MSVTSDRPDPTTPRNPASPATSAWARPAARRVSLLCPIGVSPGSSKNQPLRNLPFVRVSYDPL